MVVVRVSMRRLVGRGVEEEFPKRELARFVPRPRQVIQQRGIDSRADRPDDRGDRIAFADTLLDSLERW